jgi:hypothetical protein
MIQFLRKFFVYFSGSTDRGEPLPERVADDESLCRFIFSDKMFSSINRRVKHHAFSPKGNEVSVFRTVSLEQDDIWKMGQLQAGGARGNPRARADLLTRAVRKARLNVLSAPKSHPRHANIVDWPAEKELQQRAKMELASASTLVLPE